MPDEAALEIEVGAELFRALIVSNPKAPMRQAIAAAAHAVLGLLAVEPWKEIEQVWKKPKSEDRDGNWANNGVDTANDEITFAWGEMRRSEVDGPLWLRLTVTTTVVGALRGTVVAIHQSVQT